MPVAFDPQTLDTIGVVQFEDDLKGVVLDAHDLSEIARAHVPQHIPFGFHGTFTRATNSPPAVR